MDDARQTATAAQWKLSDIVLGLAALATLQVAQLLIVRGFGAPAEPLSFATTVLRVFPTVVTAYLVLLLAYRRGFRLNSLGFVRPRTWRPAVLAWFGAILAGPTYVLIVSFLDRGQSALSFGTQASIDTRFGAFLQPGVLLWSISIVIVAPVVEEVIFRGLVFRALRTRWNFVPTLALTGLAFAAFHFDAATLPPLMVTGAFFAYAYERTGSLWGAIVPHAGLNALVLAATLAR